MNSTKSWPKVTPEHPCPRCKKTDRCTVAPDGHRGHCFRDNQTWSDPTGVSNAGYVGAAHRSAPHRQHEERDWKAEIERLREQLTEDHLKSLVEATGVPATAWVALSPGWATAEDLKRLRASGAGWQEDPPDGAWAFAEHGGDGRVVGLSLRAPDGRKGSPAGAKRGLVVPADLHQRPDPVLIVEGASDVASCCAMGLAAAGRPSNLAGAEDAAVMLDGRAALVVGERDGKPSGAWPGRDGAKSVARKIAGRWEEPVRWTLPPVGTKDMREWLKAKLTAAPTPTDEDVMKVAGQELLAALEVNAKAAKPEKRTQADALVSIAQEQYRLGMGTDGQAFAVRKEGPAIALMFRGGTSALRMALARSYRATTGKTPSNSALADALTALEGMAADLPAEPVALRLAEHDGGIVLDLGDSTGRVVIVKSDGTWTVSPVSPVLFRRSALTGALPEPEQADAAALLELRGLLNVDDDSWPLVVGWLVSTLLPEIPHPILMFGGEQGTGKSSAAKLLVSLIDPSAVPLRSQPRDSKQWAISASASWVVALDNVSIIPDWLSDALCKAVTGDGFLDRKLYTDSELAILAFRRSIIITSIDAGALRGDLGDRLLLADLERIPEDRRRTEAELKEAFETARRLLFSALLSALGRTLAALPSVKLKTMPRMADFARVLAALDTACPELTGGRALELFAGQRQRIASEVIESDAVAMAVVKLMEGNRAWTGTATDLLNTLAASPKPQGWPPNGRALAARLRRLRPALLANGIRHDPPSKQDKTRTHRLERVGEQPPEPPESPVNPPGAPEDEEACPGGTGEPEPPFGDDRPSEDAVSEAVEASSDGLGGLGGPSPHTSTRGRKAVRI